MPKKFSRPSGKGTFLRAKKAYHKSTMNTPGELQAYKAMGRGLFKAHRAKLKRV